MKKQRHYFADKGPPSQSFGFPMSHVWMWELGHKKAKHWRVDTFELGCWRRLLRIPWTARSNQSIVKEISPEYWLEGLMLKLQYFGHLMWRIDSLEKMLMLGKIKPVNPKGINSEYLLEGLMLELSSNTLATWCKVLTHWKRPWCRERVKAKGEEGVREWHD